MKPLLPLIMRPLICSADLLSRSMQGKTIIVTGGNSGIGYETVKQLARQDAEVILACRRLEAGIAAKQKILSEHSDAIVEVMELDLASLRSIRAFASHFLEQHRPLHVLVNNAGIMNTKWGKTEDGFELQFGTNHLGHFLLTELLLPALKDSAPARIINVSSCFHDFANGREGKIHFDDLHFDQRKYDGWKAYAQSKLANVLHAKELANRLEGSGVIAVSLHPGWVRTNLVKHSAPLWVQNVLLRPIFSLIGMIEPAIGAHTTLHTILSDEVVSQSGAFYSQTGMYRNREANLGGWPLVSPNPASHDTALAERLRAVSAELVGISPLS